MAAVRDGKLGIVYIDMDNVLVNFKSGIKALNLTPAEVAKHNKARDWDEIPGIFGLMSPVKGAVEAVEKLSQNFEVYILSTAPWKNPSAWHDKIVWIHNHFNALEDKNHDIYKRLILSHHKDLNIGDYLIDDRRANGADKFRGELIQFGRKSKKEQRDGKFPNWKSVIAYFDEIVAASQPR